MAPDIFLKSLEELLTPAVEAGGGKVQICGDRMHAYEVLLDAPATAYRVAVSLDGDKPPGRHAGVESGPVVELSVIVAVMRPGGLTVKPAKGIYKETAGGGVSLLQRGGTVRRTLAGARWFLEPGLSHPDVDPAGLRYEGASIKHPEPADETEAGFRPVVEFSYKIWIALDPPADDEHTDLYPEADTVAEVYKVPDKPCEWTLAATRWADDAEEITFLQTTEDVTINLQGPTDDSAKVITIRHSGTAAFMLGSLNIPPGFTGQIVWDSGNNAWAGVA